MLITAASGDVGYFACRRAQRAGAQRAGAARDAGAHEVVLDSELATQGAALGGFDSIVESLGVRTLTAVLKLLTPRGVCVTLGATAGAEIAFEMREFFALGGVALLDFHGVRDLEVGSPLGPDLARLARLIAEGHRRAPVEVAAPWTEIAEQAQALLERKLTGQAALWVDG
jgi:NADPH2:quinone reductase